MKKLIPILSIAVAMAACNPAPKTDAASSATDMSQPVQPAVLDTAGLAEYQAWKVQNELEDTKQYNTPSVEPGQTAPVARTRKVKRPQPSYTSKTESPVETSVPSSVPASTPESTASNGGSGTVSNDGGTATSESSGTAKTEEKKGWSKSAKGAVIGGVIGAGAGAVINKKNPVAGAVIGGVLGAGGGYVIGKKMDKKDGRF
jgi:hypothetical protein